MYDSDSEDRFASLISNAEETFWKSYKSGPQNSASEDSGSNPVPSSLRREAASTSSGSEEVAQPPKRVKRNSDQHKKTLLRRILSSSDGSDDPDEEEAPSAPPVIAASGAGGSLLKAILKTLKTPSTNENHESSTLEANTPFSAALPESFNLFEGDISILNGENLPGTSSNLSTTETRLGIHPGSHRGKSRGPVNIRKRGPSRYLTRSLGLQIVENAETLPQVQNVQQTSSLTSIEQAIDAAVARCHSPSSVGGRSVHIWNRLQQNSLGLSPQISSNISNLTPVVDRPPTPPCPRFQHELLNPIVQVKVLWKGMQRKIFKVKRFTPLKLIVDYFAAEENVDSNDIFFSHNDKMVSLNAHSCVTLRYLPHEEIEGSVMSGTNSNAVLPRKFPKGVKLKVRYHKQCENFVLENNISMDHLYAQVVIKFNLGFGNFKLEFDGRLIDYRDTIKEIGLEEDDCIDILV